MESKTHIDVPVLIIIATMGICILISFIIVFILLYQKKVLSHKTSLRENENSYQRVLLNTSVEIAEHERKKIAANIHDDIGMMLNVLKLNLSKIENNIDNGPLIKKTLNDSKVLVKETISNIRLISYDLMPPTLIKLGFMKGIGELCNQVNTSGFVSMVLNSEITDISIDKKKEIQLYRLVKEIINNIIKHAAASHIKISIEQSGSSLILFISHNGKGITTAKAKQLSESGEGLGLKSIFSRVHLTDSTIEYFVGKETGIVIKTSLS